MCVYVCVCVCVGGGGGWGGGGGGWGWEGWGGGANHLYLQLRAKLNYGKPGNPEKPTTFSRALTDSFHISVIMSPQPP